MRWLKAAKGMIFDNVLLVYFMINLIIKNQVSCNKIYSFTNIIFCQVGTIKKTSFCSQFLTKLP